MLQRVMGCQICYDIKYNDKVNAVPVLFLHGWGCNMNYFADAMASMQDYATLITLDFPAHGQSEEPPEPWGVGDFALQVKQLLDVFRIVKVQIVAHSFGGRVAIYLASHYPELVDKLVITGGAGLRKPPDKRASAKTTRYKRLKQAAEALKKVPLLQAPMEKAQEKLVQQYGSPDYVKLSQTMRASFVKIVSEDLTPLLSGIKAPALLIWGENDTETPLWMGQTMEREIPDAGLIVFNGRSHFAYLEEKERFILIVRQFFWGGQAA